jgi:hypothetical protein
MGSLNFNPVDHSYWYNGKRVPSVTGILGDFIKVDIAGVQYHIGRNSGAVIPSEVMEAAAAKGTDIHAGCELIANGKLDWSALDGMYTGPLLQFEKWKSEHKPAIMFTEAPFYSVRYGYAGTIDIIAQIGKSLCFIDIKTGASSSVGPQLAAYEAGWCEHNKYRGKTERWALWIPKNGDPYKFERLTGKQDFDYFKACLFQHNYLKGGK